ncbi:hypothetical protein CANINC_000650 [Pichia inconspicua]|uniref:2-dehydropantoate 2-reductase n=1 Tax=Pichia inconspicua TaxID=52247 RepID=A0A4T0X788_9ASCO|nr:hypothetical protein CANINC_000650 [[Candida] inconspicua]
MTTKVLIIGVGGVGSIAAYTLQNNGAQVSVVARSAYDVLKDTGFTIESCDYGTINFKPDHVYKSAKEAHDDQGKFDYIVITTKNIPDVSPVEKMIEDVYDKDTSIVLLENGVGIERSMFKAYPDSTVISGVTMISSTLYGSTVKHVGKDTVSFGPFINPNINKDKQIESAKNFTKLYYNEHNQAKYDENVKYIRWRKLVYNAAINTTCAITNVDAGRLEIFGGMDSIVRPAMKEVLAIAKSDGVELPEDIIDFMIYSDDGEYYPPSMLIDIRKGQYTEYKTILGTALDIAKENGVPAPVLTILCNLLEVIQLRTMEEKGRIDLPERRPLVSEKYKLEYKY